MHILLVTKNKLSLPYATNAFSINSLITRCTEQFAVGSFFFFILANIYFVSRFPISSPQVLSAVWMSPSLSWISLSNRFAWTFQVPPSRNKSTSSRNIAKKLLIELYLASGTSEMYVCMYVLKDRFIYVDLNGYLNYSKDKLSHFICY